MTGGNLDQSRRHHNLILQALGVKIRLRLRTSRFGLLTHKRSRQVKNHNLMGFKGPAPLPPTGALATAVGHPRTEEDFRAVRQTLRRLGVVLEAESFSRARMERLRLLNDDSLRSTVSCCSDCGDGGGNRAHYVPISDLFTKGRGVAAATATTAASTEGQQEEQQQQQQQQQEGYECSAGCDHAPVAPAPAAADGESALEEAAAAPAPVAQSPAWHCRSFRKTDKGILVVEE